MSSIPKVPKTSPGEVGPTKVQGISYLRDLVREKSESLEKVRGYLTFVPAMLVRMLEDELLSSESKQDTAQVSYQHGIVFFADISGFTKLTERLADEPNGAERLCFELDKVYALILSEADKWGGDCIKFAGDAILFCWPIHAEEGTEAFDLEYKKCAVRAAKCSLLVHESVKKHPEVAGVKLTLHAGMGCGKLAACLLGGCFSRWEFVIAGEPMGQIAKSEPAAQPGETVYSPEIAALLKDLVIAEEITGEDDPAKGYFRLRAMTPPEDVHIGSRQLCTLSPPLKTLSSRTFESVIQDQSFNRLYSFVPRYIVNMMENKGKDDDQSALTDKLAMQFASIGRSEMREVSTIFVKLLGVDLSLDINGSQEVFRLCQNATYAFGGSINKLLVDDKGTLVVIVFGLPPLVHRDSPDRAIASAFLLIKLLKELNEKRLRNSHPSERLGRQDIIAHMGITSARTFCGIIGAEHRREFTVMGDAVNMAARLMAACSSTKFPDSEGDPSIISLSPRHSKHGEKEWQALLLVDQPTAEAASLSVHCTALGSINVKGKSHPIEIYHPTRFYDNRNGLVQAQKPGNEVEVYGAPLGLVGDIAKANVMALEQAVAKLSGNKSSPSGQPVPTVMMISGEQGFGKHSIAKVLLDICPRYNVEIANSTRSTATHNMYQDGVLELEVEFKAFRGPLLSMLSKLVNTGRLPKYDKSPLEEKEEEMIGRISEVNVFRAVRAILPSYLHTDVPLLARMYPEMPDFESTMNTMSTESSSIDEAIEEDISPLFREHVAERMEYLHSRLNKDKSFKVTIAGEMDGTNPTCLLGRGDEAQQWADASMAHAYSGFMKMLDDSVYELYSRFPKQVSFGDVSSESASPTHYQVWGGHALNWKVEGEGSAIVGASQPGITTQKEGVFGVVTSPLHGAPAREKCQDGYCKSWRSKLIKLVVAITTRCFELADKPCGSSPAFKFLIVIEHAHITMGYRSWEIVNALMKVGGQTKAASTVKQLKRMSTSEAMATAFASASRPLLCMVSRPLKRFAATPEYFEMLEETSRYDTLIQVQEMTETDTDLLLRRCIAKRLWNVSSDKDIGVYELAQKLKKSRPSFPQFEESIIIDVSLLDFCWDSTHGCPFEIIAVSDNLAQSNMLTFEWNDSGGVSALVAEGKSLDTMSLSHVLKSSVISRFHAILDEKPFIWSHIVRLASCFKSHFTAAMLCKLLKSMKNNEGGPCNLDFPENYITHMLHQLVGCFIFRRAEKISSNGTISNGTVGSVPTTPMGRPVTPVMRTIAPNYAAAAASLVNNAPHPTDAAFEFRSKLVCHALRETLLESQLNVHIDEEFKPHCEPILRMHSHRFSGSAIAKSELSSRINSEDEIVKPESIKE